MTRFERRDSIRNAFTLPILAGQGLEIGAGAFPQKLPSGATALYYDMRDDNEARTLFGEDVVQARSMTSLHSDFPNGADFLIAHNVLEHCPDPVGTLIDWHKTVKNGGMIILSLPHIRYCPDDDRIIPPHKHLIEDYLNAADGTDFSSREHIASFVVGWHVDFCRHLNIERIADFCMNISRVSRTDSNDLHWHAFDTDTSLAIVELACMLGGLQHSFMRCWSPETGETIGDILLSYTITKHSDDSVLRELLQADRRRKKLVDQIDHDIGQKIGLFRSNERVVSRLERPFIQEGRFGFLAPLPSDFLSRAKSGMLLSIRENEQALGPENALHESIRTQGGGRFSFWNDAVYFSSIDNSNCNDNGREYDVIADMPKIED